MNQEKNFKLYQRELPFAVKKEVVKFLYNINLTLNVSYSSFKQANFYIDNPNIKYKSDNEKYLFYYAVLKMMNKDIGDYMKDLKLDVETIGDLTDDSNCYVYLGRKRSFVRNDQVSEKYFDLLCNELNISHSDVLKVHYKELYRINNIIKKLVTCNI